MNLIRSLTVTLTACVVWLGGCSSSPVAVVNGSCTLVPNATERCGDVAWRKPAAGETVATNDALGLAVYSCTGTARPDDSPNYVNGVPQGTVCAQRANAGVDGGTGDSTTYCCTTATTACAYNPVAICEDARSGFQCRGSLRPDAYNSALTCGNGVEQGDLLDYCCSGSIEPTTCTQVNSIGCSARLFGFSCERNSLPRGEQLGANQSRADFYHLLCPTATIPKDNPRVKTYCCYMPALVPEGGTCVQDTTVPGCAAGRFGFACYGPDTPDQDYLPMHCPDPGVPGTSAEGYPASLYCCDFQ